VLARLENQASAHGRTIEAEVKVILTEALQSQPAGTWDEVDAIQRRLASSGRCFGDSAELVREDRHR
jgi:plasmid stability protein